MIEIQNNAPDSLPIDEGLLKSAIQLTLEVSDKPDADVTLRLTDDGEVQSLNKQFRTIDKSTDVLSFEQNIIDPETGRWILGDIIISYQRARDQAGQHNHSLDKECSLLTIHGTLHLLGYDHDNPHQKAIMWAIQDKLLDQLFEGSAKESAEK